METRDKFEAWYADFFGQTVEWVKSHRASETHYQVGPEIQCFWLCYQAALVSQQPLPLPPEEA
jgi:hypothetical protein